MGFIESSPMPKLGFDPGPNKKIFTEFSSKIVQIFWEIRGDSVRASLLFGIQWFGVLFR